MALDFTKANLHRNLSLSELATSVDISRSHLCHLFKTETGMSPGQYLLMLKMQKACELLATTLLSVKYIMIEVGYSSKSHFVRHFKQAYGLTPSEYRTEHVDYSDQALRGPAES
jgi:AraC-like DNA-binding protein